MAVVGLDPDGSIRLLSAILWELPSLPGAACRERPGLFDDQLVGETRDARQERLDAAVTRLLRLSRAGGVRAAAATSRWRGRCAGWPGAGRLSGC